MYLLEAITIACYWTSVDNKRFNLQEQNRTELERQILSLNTSHEEEEYVEEYWEGRAKGRVGLPDWSGNPIGPLKKGTMDPLF